MYRMLIVIVLSTIYILETSLEESGVNYSHVIFHRTLYVHT